MAPRAPIALLAALVTVGVATPAQAACSGRLVAFRSCPDLVHYAKANAARFVGPYGLGSPVGIRKVGPGGVLTPSVAADSTQQAPQEGVDYSGTNVQETGVDEPDLLKTNGDTLFTISGNQLESVDVSGKAPRLLDTLKLSNGWSTNDLLLSGTHLLVLSRGGYWIEPLPAMAARMIAPIATTSVLTEVDVSDPSKLAVLKTLTLAASYVAPRQIRSHRPVASTPTL